MAKVPYRGRNFIAAASEARGGACLLLDPDRPDSHRVWNAPGGTMSIVPAGDAHFFAVQQFYAGFDAAASVIVDARGTTPNGSWEITEKLKLPYLHRLAMVSNRSDPTLLACTLCGGKDHVDDWSKPGAVYRIMTTTTNGGAWRVVPVLEQIRRNHGLAMTQLDGDDVAVIGAMEGLFAITLSDNGGKWGVRKLLDGDVSDVVALDWDHDGQEELMTIEPFHGDRFVFYKRDNGGKWRALHEMPCRLGHSLWAGRALGRPTIIAGERLGEGRIQLVFPTAGHPNEWERLVVDHGTGGTNVALVAATERSLEFVSANNDRNEVVHYRVGL